jgi:hypothetical protein
MIGQVESGRSRRQTGTGDRGHQHQPGGAAQTATKPSINGHVQSS